jgi:hypothetical protein
MLAKHISAWRLEVSTWCWLPSLEKIIQKTSVQKKSDESHKGRGQTKEMTGAEGNYGTTHS